MNSAPLPSTAELGFARNQGAAEMRRSRAPEMGTGLAPGDA